MEDFSATEKDTGRNIRRWLFNPFYYIAGGKALLVGVGFILATGFIAYQANCRFDGVLDFHLGATAQVPLGVSLSEGLISWLIMGVLLLAGGKIISSSRVRVLDVVGTQALARAPYLLTALFSLLPGVSRFAQQISSGQAALQAHLKAFPLDALSFGVNLLVAISMTIWMVALMYRAYAVSCNVSGGKAVGVFIAAVILGEVISKVLLLYIF